MRVHYCRLIDRESIADRGFPGFVLLFLADIIPNFCLMINAPNPILNDESWCTHFAGEVFSIFWFKFWPRYYLGHLYPTVICWQLPSKRQFKVGGWGGSKLSFYVDDRARWCKGSEAVLAVFLALVHLFLLRPPIECLLGQLIQQALFTNSVRVLTAMPHRRTDLPLILASDTDLP